MKLLFSAEWLRKKIADDPEEPAGCPGCGAIAGCCDKYPECPGNPEWKADQKHAYSEDSK